MEPKYEKRPAVQSNLKSRYFFSGERSIAYLRTVKCKSGAREN